MAVNNRLSWLLLTSDSPHTFNDLDGHWHRVPPQPFPHLSKVALSQLPPQGELPARALPAVPLGGSLSDGHGMAHSAQPDSQDLLLVPAAALGAHRGAGHGAPPARAEPEHCPSLCAHWGILCMSILCWDPRCARRRVWRLPNTRSSSHNSLLIRPQKWLFSISTNKQKCMN